MIPWYRSADGHPLIIPSPGQFVVLRLQPKPNGAPLLRNYSLSGAPRADRYRVSVKLEPNGAASTYLDVQTKVGDVLDVTAPRGSFTLRPGSGPVVLLSAGVGATPVMAMLHALVSENSQREVWWLFGARDRKDHPFAEESRNLLKALAHSKSYIGYSRPGPSDRQGADYDGPGRLGVTVLDHSTEFPRFRPCSHTAKPRCVKRIVRCQSRAVASSPAETGGRRITLR